MMTRTLAALAAPLLFLVAGLGLAELLQLGRAEGRIGGGIRARIGKAGRLGYGYLLGIVWVAGGLYVLSHLAGVPVRRPAVLALAAAPVLVGAVVYLLRRRKPGWIRRRPRGRRLPLPAVAALVVAAAVTLALLADALSRPPGDWDGRMTWGTQARYVRAAGTVDLPVLREPQWFVSHPHYPLLLPLAQVAVLEAFGAGPDEAPFRTLYVAFFPALLLVLWDGARRLAGPRAAAWTTLAAAVLPFPALNQDGGASGGYSDLPLACFYGAALVLLLRGRRTAEEATAAGLLLAGAVLCKNEGTFLAAFALLLTGALALVSRRRNSPPISPARHAPGGTPVRWRTGESGHRRRPARPGAAALLLAALPPLAAFALLASWRAEIPNRFYDAYEKTFDAGRLLPDALARAPELLPRMARQMTSFLDWGLFWWALPLVLLAAGGRAWRRPRALLLALAAALPLAIAWGAYAVYPDSTYLVGVTWNRMLLQASLPLLLLLALALRPLLQAVPEIGRIGKLRLPRRPAR